MVIDDVKSANIEVTVVTMLHRNLLRQCCQGVLDKDLGFNRLVMVQAYYLHTNYYKAHVGLVSGISNNYCQLNYGQRECPPKVGNYSCCGIRRIMGGPDKKLKSGPMYSLITRPEKEVQVRKENREIMTRLLGGRPEEIVRTPYRAINEEKAKRMMETLNHFGFSSKSIRLYPELLLMPVSAVENYIRIMKESCFPSSSIREPVILRFRVMNRQSISVLQNEMQLPDINKIIDQYTVELEESDSFRDLFITKLPADKDRLTLMQLRSEMIAAYLRRLSLGTVADLKKAFSTYPRIHYRSLNWIKRNYRYLKDLDFTNDKIMRHYYLLHADANEVSKIAQIETLAGMPFKHFVHHRPKILMSTYDTLLQIEKNLISHNIPFESIQKYPEIYTLSAATIEQRLQEINDIPEFQLMKNHPRICRLLYYFTKAKARLGEFRTPQHTRVPSIHLLSTDNMRFKKALTTGDLRIRGVDIMIYLAELFNTDKKRIRESLTRHPHWLQIPLVNVQLVLNLIKSVGSFDNDKLIDVIPILLYPVEKVEKGIKDVMESGEAAPSDPYFLQMVLYFIERPSHFSGDAVWPTNDGHDHDEGYDEDDESEGGVRKIE